ncbi:chemotaxis protein CheB [Pedobacter sp. PWIIR3]
MTNKCLYNKALRVCIFNRNFGQYKAHTSSEMLEAFQKYYKFKQQVLAVVYQIKFSHAVMDKTFYTLGIGASAGGQLALSEFFDHLAPDIKIAIVVVTHLMRERRSILDKILAKHTTVPIKRVDNDMQLEPGCIYILPENTTMIVEDGWLKVHTRDQQIENKSVDIFFESMANDFKEKAIGIILSGGGKDGLKGALRIRETGGLVFVQDLQTATVTGMPSSIIDFDHPTAILNPSELAGRINQYI